MIRIVILATLGNIGGIETSLINLLKSVDYNRYAITLLNFGKNKKLYGLIPREVHIEHVELTSWVNSLSILVKQRKYSEAFRLLLMRVCAKISGRTSFSQYPPSNCIPFLDGDDNFDMAISWGLPDSALTVYCAEMVNARKRVMTIHMDLSYYVMPKDSQKVLTAFDEFWCASAACKNSFESRFPSFAIKARVVYNVIDLGRSSGAFTEEEIISNGVAVICTCGRLAPEKQPLLIPKIAERVREGCGVNFIWLVIGDGPLLEELNTQIRNKGLDNILVLGSLENPFPYIERSSIYVQLSTHEAFCLSLAEAQLLGVPAISTPFDSASEIIEQGKTGLIVQNDAISLADAITSLLVNRLTLEEMRRECKKDAYKKRYCGDFKRFDEAISRLLDSK